MPGTHHVEARVFKDVFPRFKTMKGYHVARMAGWDCHGLPVELAVEKELGFTGKPDIEAYGIAEFNAKCRENVQRHVDAFEQMSERMGYWADYENAYWTMNPDYVESVWWALKQIFDKGLLVEDYRVAPYCPRCGTGAVRPRGRQGYEDVTDPSVYVRFPLTSGPWAGAAPTCWSGRRRRGRWSRTPPSPCNPDVAYVVARHRRRRRSSSPSRSPRRCSARTPRCSATVRRPELERLDLPAAVRLVEFRLAGRRAAANYVVLADYVTTDDGSGLVHQAPAFGADDLAVGARLRPAGGQPDRHRRALRRRRARWSAGMFFKDADEHAGRRPARARAAVPARRPTRTATRTAGAATRR